MLHRSLPSPSRYFRFPPNELLRPPNELDPADDGREAPQLLEGVLGREPQLLLDDDGGVLGGVLGFGDAAPADGAPADDGAPNPVAVGLPFAGSRTPKFWADLPLDDRLFGAAEALGLKRDSAWVANRGAAPAGGACRWTGATRASVR